MTSINEAFGQIAGSQQASKDFFWYMQKAHHCLFGILPAENEHEH